MGGPVGCRAPVRGGPLCLPGGHGFALAAAIGAAAMGQWKTFQGGPRALTIPGAEVPSVRAQNLVLPSVQSGLAARNMAGPAVSLLPVGRRWAEGPPWGSVISGAVTQAAAGCLRSMSVRSCFRNAAAAAGASEGRCAMLLQGDTKAAQGNRFGHAGLPLYRPASYRRPGRNSLRLPPSSPSGPAKSMNNTMIPLTVFACPPALIRYGEAAAGPWGEADGAINGQADVKVKALLTASHP